MNAQLFYGPLLLVPLVAGAVPSRDVTPGFDWALLKGKWAESVRHQFGCTPENLHQWFTVSDDRKTLTFHNDRKWTIGTGQQVERYSADILRAAPNVLVIRYGSALAGIPDDMREWEMRFIGPGAYRWRAMVWREGEYNDVIGVRCSAK